MVGCVEMKFIVFWEYRLEDMGKIIEKTKKLREDDEKNPGKWGTYLFPPHHMSQNKGFFIAEVTEEQMRVVYLFWVPEMKMKFYPITESFKMNEEYLRALKK
jgi:hypothetical protein